MSAARLQPRASYAPELSTEELAILAALTDEQKLAVGHAIRLTSIEVRGELLGALKAAEDYLDSSLSPCEPDCECVLHIVQAAIARAEGRA